MNTQTSVVLESSPQPQGAAPASISAARLLYWSVCRELWEYRSIYIAPLAVAIAYLVGVVINMIQTAGRMRWMGLYPSYHVTLDMPYNTATAVIMVTALIIEIFYCVEALHGERRDRSILFWKSLPVSDLITVLAKASVPFVILPLVAFAIVVAAYVIMLLLGSVILLGHGLSFGSMWAQLGLPQKVVALLYHLITVHVLWYAPIYGWLLLVSGWARRMPFLWAILPPIAVIAVERMVFNTSYIGDWLNYRLSGPEKFFFPTQSNMDMHWMHHLDPGKFLSTPGLWTGLIVAAALLAATVRLRRYRGPI
jgi:ABC-2 type transport system permease protein